MGLQVDKGYQHNDCSAISKQKRSKIVAPMSLLKAAVTSIADGIIICDPDNMIVLINPAALAMFEISGETSYLGTDYNHFLSHYVIHNEDQCPTTLVQDQTSDAGDVHTISIKTPSGRKAYVQVRSVPIFDQRKQKIDQRKQKRGMIHVFHDVTELRQKELHYQKSNQSLQALLSLLTAITYLPTIVDLLPREEQGPFLLPPSMHYIGQQLTNLVLQILRCKLVMLLSLRPPENHLYYVAVSGLEPEQEQIRRENSGRYTLADFYDEQIRAKLYSGEVVILPYSRIHLPFYERSDRNGLLTLHVPLFVDKQLAGILLIARSDSDNAYTPEEITLAKSVATLIVFVIECVSALNQLNGTRGKALMRQEADKIINEFLYLASHELRTPLTAIIGNLQLALHRLDVLQRQARDHPEILAQRLEYFRQPLEQAAQSARLQEWMIQNMLDDVSIQTHTLTLHMRRCDLSQIVQETVREQQERILDHKILLEITPTSEVIPVIADEKSIRRVLLIYLKNALTYSPRDCPVRTQVVREGALARVSVHSHGAGISLQEQEHVWDRFYRTQGVAVQHELDLSLGLELYICKAFIEYHHGHVGMQSDPGHGTTFWFILPIVESSADKLDPSH
ncbi:PAS/PAC sensor signal transduction histidine kinase [Ktedonobacter racemifer DSM 44963]|uniref:histidine kinase n=2 Tax=Ktedonobacter racemifer TaxID=363277 RepID=D6U7C4_KTERA|nr:PAS/PAC sensor signal transduction histidine kinase [Ktedonobacter racemifer DSM 44963]